MQIAWAFHFTFRYEGCLELDGLILLWLLRRHLRPEHPHFTKDGLSQQGQTVRTSEKIAESMVKLANDSIRGFFNVVRMEPFKNIGKIWSVIR
ncbi:hypothetical protein FRX31_011296 [Thalictrum thalictroides]|uniref:Uncharacterized protein n=1 Tax=Thalictrum thalictroides TaxID=46969 RepID=A0A7J6WQA9_THATH|nr:hypothetical protein FRX31_011296 [Thalictrum thalictroides]